MGIDGGGVHGVDAGDTSTFLRLMEDDVDGPDQGVGKMKWFDVVWESTEFLKTGDHGEEALE